MCALGFVNAQLFLQILFAKIKAVVIDKVIGTGVVGRVNVNALYLSFVGAAHVLEDLQIVARKVKVFAVLVFVLPVVFLVGDNHRLGVERVKEPGVILAQKIERFAFFDHQVFVTHGKFRPIAYRVGIYRSLFSEGVRNQRFQFLEKIVVRVHLFVFLHDVAYHRAVPYRCEFRPALHTVH